MLTPLYHSIKRSVFPGAAHRQRPHHFLAAWIRSPLKVGALLPSSRTLARAMAAEIDLGKSGIIIELGAGTGAVTHALLQAGITSERLLVIERDRKLHAVMSSRFPGLNVVCADAVDLDQVLIDQKITKVNAIVSSLPLLSMPKPVRHAIQECMASCIGHDGTIIQFTYGPRSPISGRQLHKYHLHGQRRRTVMTNVPPAHVWVYRKD
jgi:phosphatidylethanolamine/phosphatidyl-N-methylethanolamine N-methyltransferase